MKTKLLIGIFLMIFIPSALAISGGETWLYHFDYCDELTINITANQTIDEGEYTILNECEGENNYFVCNCSNDFDFNVSFKINAVNNYFFSFNYDYTKEVVETISESSTGGGGGGGVFSKHLSVGIPFKAVLVGDLNSYFYFNGKKHTMKMLSYTNDSVKLEITSEPITVGLSLNETKEIDFEEGILRIYFMKIKRNVVTLQLTSLPKGIINGTDAILTEIEPITISEPAEIEEIPEEEFEEPVFEEAEEEKTSGWLIAGVIFVVISSVSLIIYMVRKKKEEKE